MNGELKRIMGIHQYCESYYISSEELESMDAGAASIVPVLREKVFAKSNLSEDDVQFTAHLIDHTEGKKIIAVTADSKEHYRNIGKK